MSHKILALAVLLFCYTYVFLSNLWSKLLSLICAAGIGTDVPWLRLNRAELLRRTGRYQEALAIYNRAVEEGAGNKQVFNAAISGVASVNTYLGNFEEAKAAHLRKIDSDPESARTLANYAHFLLCYYKDIDAAISVSEKVLGVMNTRAARLTYASALYSKWAMLNKQGDKEGAQAYFDKARQLFPQTNAIEERLINVPHLRFVAIDLAVRHTKMHPVTAFVPDGGIEGFALKRTG